MIKLREYQEDGLTAIWNYFNSGKTGNPVLSWPCGVGKSVIPAVFIERIMKVWPTQRFMMVTHVKELIEQNAEVMRYVWNNAPLGIYSSGLKSRDTALPIIFAGIQSAINRPMLFGHRDIIFIDEAHLVSQEESSQYLTFLATMRLINPQLKIIGMTATPFRMGQGLITDNGLFTDIIHDLSGIEGFNRLIAEGYLCPLIPHRTQTELDVSSVGMRNNEYIPGQLQSAVDKEAITKAALKEAIDAGHDRRSWLIFSSGIEHANHIADILTNLGVDCASVHSKQTEQYNSAAIKAFKSGQLRAIVNYSKLTTGFNNPHIDYIIDLRPTLSIPLHVQKLGRGTRPADGKKDCKVLDFARNVPRLGCINDPAIPKRKGDKVGDTPVKICDACGAYNHTTVRFCCECENEFVFRVKITAKAGTEAIIRSDLPVVETFDVDRAVYAVHNKPGSKPTLKVTYFCNMQMFREWICLEHDGLIGKKARDLWRQMHRSDPPKTVVEAMQYAKELRMPKRLKVWVNRKFPEILNREW